MRHVLSHRSGAIGVPGVDRLLSWDGAGWSDTAAIAAAIADAQPAWQPGSRHGYHGLTFGWLVGELVRRIAGVSLGTFFRTEVAEPLGLDCRIGTPDADLARVAACHRMDAACVARRPDADAPLIPSRGPGTPCLPGRTALIFADADGRAPLRRVHEHAGRAACGDRRDRRDRQARGLARAVQRPRLR